MGVITFNGIASDKLGIQVEHPPGYETPKKDYEIVHVPGRNGDVYIDIAFSGGITSVEVIPKWWTL